MCFLSTYYYYHYKNKKKIEKSTWKRENQYPSQCVLKNL